MNVLQFAAIDIGSNGVRLLISNVVESKKEEALFKKSSLTRVPIRLGAEAFNNGFISKKTVDRLLHAMHAYKHLMDAHSIVGYLGSATSAMREAKNGKAIVKRIEKETGLKIQIIDGKKEAEIIYSTQIAQHLSSNKPYLYVDVGGGSTEMTLFSKGKSIASYSFNIGTLRILSKSTTAKDWKLMKTWLKELTERTPPVALIGSGGNINRIFKMSHQKDGKPLMLPQLKGLHSFINTFSIEDRIKVLDMRPDRADVIIPALDIFISAMKWSDCKKIYVPKIGLADGLIHIAYEQFLLDSKKVIGLN